MLLKLDFFNEMQLLWSSCDIEVVICVCTHVIVFVLACECVFVLSVRT